MRIINILLFIIVLSSCNSEDPKFDTIEFIGYGYIKVPARDKQFDEEWELVAPLYLKINNDYHFQYFFEKKDSGFTYIAMNANEQMKAIAKGVLNSSDTFSGDLDLRPKGLFFYHGLQLMIKISIGGQIKIIHYWQNQGNCQTYEKLFNLADQVYKTNYKTTLDYPSGVFKDRYNLMGIASQLDSILRPLPPLPPKDFHPQYTPPTIDSAYL
jgi:hypothetical protein